MVSLLRLSSFLLVCRLFEFVEHFEQFLLLPVLLRLFLLQSLVEKTVLNNGALQVLATVAIFDVHSVIKN